MTAELALQLYTLREECEADLAGVLGRVGEIGYAGVEFAGLHGHTADEVARMLESAAWSQPAPTSGSTRA